MKIRFVLAGVAALSLAACGSSDDASLEADAESVEVPANEALEGIEEEPVEDPAATMPEETEEPTAAQTANEAQAVEEASENAAANAAAAADAMVED